MKLTINGERREVESAGTVAGLLAELGMDGRPCAVEMNGEVVPRAEHPQRQVREGDRIELVTLVGGG